MARSTSDRYIRGAVFYGDVGVVSCTYEDGSDGVGVLLLSASDIP